MTPAPRWISLFIGSIMMLIAALILGAVVGLVPIGSGEFLAPTVVIVSLGLCFLLGGVLLWLPHQTPVFLRGGLFTWALLFLAITCNWTAFAPGVAYYSSSSIGPLEFGGEDRVGGRIVFGLAAIAVNLLILDVIVGWARGRLRRERSHNGADSSQEG
jgi:hypothetical protein